jgi:hypothetical protein
MDYSASIPPVFWKVCRLRRQDGSLSATGFKLGQEDITDLPRFEGKVDIGIGSLDQSCPQHGSWTAGFEDWFGGVLLLHGLPEIVPPEFFLFVLFFDFRRRHGLREG